MMEYFNRYTSEIDHYHYYGMDYSHYGVTEKDCYEYVKKLKQAQINNTERIKKRNKSLRLFLIIISFILAQLPIIFVYYYIELPWITKFLVLGGTWGTILFMFEKIEKRILDELKDYYDELFPPINKKIELLLEDCIKKRYDDITKQFDKENNNKE